MPLETLKDGVIIAGHANLRQGITEPDIVVDGCLASFGQFQVIHRLLFQIG